MVTVKNLKKMRKKILSTNDISKMEVITAGDFNKNLVDLKKNKKIKNFLNVMFGHSMMPIINKLTHVAKNTETALDHIFNSAATNKFKSGIKKSDILDRFPTFSVTCLGVTFLYFRGKFKYKLFTVRWNIITDSSDTNKQYDNFIWQVFRQKIYIKVSKVQ